MTAEKKKIRKRRRAKKLTKAKVIDKLVALGKEKGHITYEELNSILPDDMFSSEEITAYFIRRPKDVSPISSTIMRSVSPANSSKYPMAVS